MIYNWSRIPVDSEGRQLPDKFSNFSLHFFDFIANAGDVHQYIASCIPAHWHDELEVFMLIEGTVKIEIENKSYYLSPGNACFINSGILHSFKCENSSPCIYHSFVFDASIVSGVSGSIFDVNYMKPLIENGPAYFEIKNIPDNSAFFCSFNRVFEACRAEKYGYEFDVRAGLSDIILYFSKTFASLTSKKCETIQEQHIKKILCWIDENLCSKITLNDIAASAGISARECQRIFKQFLHRSPMEYLQWKRILAAAKELADSDNDITYIALNYGFSSPSYFSRLFKEFTGHTPGQYRALVQQSPENTIT